MRKRSSFILPRDLIFIFLLTLGFTILYSFVSLIKHWHFQTGLDLAIYNQALWFYSHFKLPYVTLYPTFGRLVWADHFTPTLALLAPLYRFFPSSEMLLIFQAVFFSSGAIPLYLITKEKTRDFFLSLAIVLSYFLFFGSQFALTFDFHAATFGASFLPWIFYFLEKSKWKAFFPLVFLALGAKEDMALAVFSLGIFMLFCPKRRRMGFITVALAILYFSVTIFYLIPTFSQGMIKEYVASNLPTTFDGWINFWLAPIRLRTLFLSFFSFVFLPILAPSTWIFPLVHFLYNFLGPAGRSDIYLHYRVALAPFLAYASIYGALNLASLLKKSVKPGLAYKLSGFALILSLLVLQYFLHLPLNSLAKEDFYLTKDWMRDNQKLIEMVPSDASVSTQNHLAPHLSGRERLYYFPVKEDKVLLDLREHQPIVNFWASPSPRESQMIVEDWAKKGDYQVVQKTGEAVLLHKIK